MDYTHDSLTKRKFIPLKEIEIRFGKVDYDAFIHEMRAMGVMDNGIETLTQAVEWCHSSRHFSHIASQEMRTTLAFWISVAAIIISAFSLLLTIYPSPQT